MSFYWYASCSAAGRQLYPHLDASGEDRSLFETQNHVLSFLFGQVHRLNQVWADTATDCTCMTLNRQLAR
ncbi:hypothetical protein HK13_11165 [Acetobacter indonesiensis]|nr:hypothetical protein HK13_11165 [Acetobacter indonesiensis]